MPIHDKIAAARKISELLNATFASGDFICATKSQLIRRWAATANGSAPKFW